MRLKIVFNMLGKLLIFVGLSMFLPLLVALYYREMDAVSFLVSMGLTVSIGKIMQRFSFSQQEIRHREGFAIVTLGWILISIFGSIPFMLSGVFDNFIDAFFESVSGFTTTGATVIMSLESLSHSILFWRSLSHWLGGMGIIVMSIAILPELAGSMQLFKAEVPGPVHDRLRPRIKETAKTLWVIYLLLTVSQIILLFVNDVPLFEAVIHSFGTVSTGGFSSRTLSVRAYDSLIIDGIMVFFMFLAGTNFTLHYQVLRGNIKALFNNKEFRFYVFLVTTAIILITINLRLQVYKTIVESIRYAAFQTLSIISTAGFATVNYDIWPPFSRGILLVLMFIGGSAGSTAGGIKVIRIYALMKKGFQELYKLIHPRAVTSLKIGNRAVSEEVSTSILGFFFLYIIVFVVAAITLTSFGIDIVSSISAVAATLGNIGPGLGLIGPLKTYVPLPITGKLLLSFCMLLGRLEIYTVLVFMLSGFWRK
ncbi:MULTISPECIES: TrkH family potassium uptake protein [unclassified Candidatus Frackibacter]|uniref:TrkH family potassium uptake protein n=1 Tax=unclassified Candidatus Frackibacter TaxID=2648818 RepID=UPI00088CD5F1|nr:MULTISPECIES: potassium transporter TrkG [unclassified Candidatus Frackibacter]SDC61884.1 trk system potassium uptake protein TrkH [Candidatus Frackibacter sp. WG11]SEM75663.1 trk system potassium uptake protein TrkH [Candidatus Frackibacter sp. WG12]SFL86640.1 trk system potassium uptake protein TrkH [Candidatus Frackibacter sp. WG13]